MDGKDYSGTYYTLDGIEIHLGHKRFHAKSGVIYTINRKYRAENRQVQDIVSQAVAEQSIISELWRSEITPKCAQNKEIVKDAFIEYQEARGDPESDVGDWSKDYTFVPKTGGDGGYIGKEIVTKKAEAAGSILILIIAVPILLLLYWLGKGRTRN